MHIGIYIYPEVEVLDFAGPFEVFSTANRVRQDDERFSVSLIAEADAVVQARGGFSVAPQYTFSNHPPIDLLCIPGGVHERVLGQATSRQWIERSAQQAQRVATICTGVFLLAETDLLRAKRVTTHWEDIAALREQFGALQVLENYRWVSDGKYISSGGISAGIDMSLFLVSELIDLSTAERTARQMEYRWQKNPMTTA
ncbi:DJ-1/PfpI family protein [bacterium]|nr:DJ-1/PfpI family protein [bacterium]